MKRLLIHALWFSFAVVAYWMGGQRSHDPPRQDAKNSAGVSSVLPSHPISDRTKGSDAARHPAPTNLAEPSISKLVEGLRLNPYTNGIGRAQHMAALLERLTAENASQILEEIRKADALGTEDVHLLVQAWAAIDGERALAFVEEHSEEFGSRGGGYAYMGLILGLAERDLDAATAVILDCLDYSGIEPNLLPPKAKHAARNFSLLTHSLIADRERDGVIEWAEKLGTDYAKGYALKAVIADMVGDGEEVAASEYLSRMPVSSVRDEVVAGFASNLAKTDPASAMAWASTIQEGHRGRDQLLISIGRNWWERNPEEASAWFERTELSAEQINQIKGTTEGAEE